MTPNEEHFRKKACVIFKTGRIDKISIDLELFALNFILLHLKDIYIIIKQLQIFWSILNI
jgi:hypothetical protein